MPGNRSRGLSTIRRVAPAALAAGAIWGIREGVGRLRAADLSGQVVLVTGASRGLGLALAREFHTQGCRLAICARDPGELNRAAELLRGEGAEVHAVVCDVGDRDAVAELIADVTRRFGRIDVLVNNAGLIQLGPVQTTEPKDYRTSLDVMTFGILYPTLAVLPQMQARRAGRIVNVTSFGGKVAFPHMLPYTTAKFAAVGLSEGLRVELAAQGIAVHTVCPGPLRTGSYLAAYTSGDEQTQEAEYRWFAGGGASPFVVAADRAARIIVRGVKRGDPEIVFPTSAALLILLHGLSPGLTGDLLSLVNRYLLPEAPAPGAASETVRGMEIEPRFAGSRLWRTLTALGRRDAARLNQIPGTPQPIDDVAPAAHPAGETVLTRLGRPTGLGSDPEDATRPGG